MEVYSFLGLRRGAALHIRLQGRDYAFDLSNRGYEVGDFASAQDFCEAFQQRI